MIQDHNLSEDSGRCYHPAQTLHVKNITTKVVIATDTLCNNLLCNGDIICSRELGYILGPGKTLASNRYILFIKLYTLSRVTSAVH